MESTVLPLTAVFLGATAHLTYFRHGEHHLHGSRYLGCLLTSFSLAFFLLHYFSPAGGTEGWTQPLSRSTILHSCFLSGLCASLVIYRAFLHPLRKFPGPLGARLSAASFSWRVRNGDTYKQLAALHRQYGDFVRIGPSDLSITSPDAVNLIHGPASECTKADIYDLIKPLESLQMLRDKARHAERRRIWSYAFSDKALRGYETRITIYQDQLVSKVAAAKGRPIDMTNLFNWYSWDVMGDLAFGYSFDMLKTSKKHQAIAVLDDGLKALSFMLPMWVFRLAIAIPGLSKDWWGFIDFCRGRLLSRMKVPSPIHHRSRTDLQCNSQIHLPQISCLLC